MSDIGSCIAWPFVAVWRLAAFILEATGRLLVVLLGLIAMILGVLISLTIVGAVVGVPMILFGVVLIHCTRPLLIAASQPLDAHTV